MGIPSRKAPMVLESGLKINRKNLIVGAKIFEWRDLSTVRLVKPSNWLIRLITKEKPYFPLMVSKEGDSMTTTHFQTEDAALAKRIELAISDVAQQKGAIREI